LLAEGLDIDIAGLVRVTVRDEGGSLVIRELVALAGEHEAKLGRSQLATSVHRENVHCVADGDRVGTLLGLRRHELEELVERAVGTVLATSR
jgi:hypothetical protein